MSPDSDGDPLQNPVIHEGAAPDGRDPNEGADEKATVVDAEGSSNSQ